TKLSIYFLHQLRTRDFHCLKIKIHLLQQPPGPEGFSHYEHSSYRDESRCGTVNNLGRSTNTYTRNEVRMNPYGYRRAEYSQASTMRVTDINFSRSAPNHDPPRVYDMRNFHYSGEKFPLYQPG